MDSDCWECVFAFVRPQEEFFFAVVCKEWCAFFRKKRNQRGDFKWHTAIRCTFSIFDYLHCTNLTLYAMMHAARHNRMDILQFAKPETDTTQSLFYGAAQGGHMRVVKWARENGFKWDMYALEAAAAHGHLEVIQYLREHGCSWNSCEAAALCEAAAANGQLEVLKYLRKHGCPWDARTASEASRAGHMDVFHWAVKNGCPLDRFILEKL